MKKLISIALTLMMVISSFAGFGTVSFAADDDVIKIYTVEDLYAINNNMSGNYKLMNDIDLGDATAEGGDYDFILNGSSGWEPIGGGGSYADGKFYGTFDGNGYSISNIRIECNYQKGSAHEYLGLFADNRGTIKNLHCEYSDYEFNGTSYQAEMGGIAGYNSGTITNCSCSADMKLYGTCGYYMYFGGIVGNNNSSAKIENSWFSGSIKIYGTSNLGDAHIGGIVGNQLGGQGWPIQISNCYNTGNMMDETGKAKVAGICGYESTSYAGGNIYRCGIQYCYNVGKVPSTGYQISNPGKDGSNKAGCYFLSAENGQYTEPDDHMLIVNQMVKANSFSGYDFDSTWVIDPESYYKYPQICSNRMDNKDIDQIKIKTMPSRTDYWTGDSIDSTDGRITIYYKNDTTKTIDMADYMFEDVELTETGSQTITGYYLGIPFTFTANVTQRPEIVSLVVINEPTNKTFVKGTEFDFSGCKIRATYEDGTVIDIEPTAENTEGGNINNTGKQTISYSLDGKTASFDVTVIPVEATSIKVTTKPTRTTWVEGEDINLYGMVVTATYNNGEKVNLKSTEYEISELPEAVGKHKITITYGDLTTDFQLTIATKELQSIEVTTKPDITEYVIGQEFNRSGMVVKAAYNNNKMVEINDYTVSELPTEIGYGDVVIEWGGMTTTTQVKMIAKEVSKIRVSENPNKTTYISGEDIKTDGIKVVKVYNDKSEEEISDYTVATKTAPGTGSKKVTIEWQGFTTTYNITVVEKTVVDLTIVPPDKTDYIDDEEFDATGMIVNAVYDSGKSEKIDEGNYEIDGFDEIEHYGLVTISYEGVEKSIYVYRHSSGEWRQTKDPKCEEKGEKTLYCSVCNVPIDTEEIKANGHSFGEWQTISSPGCINKGSEQRECSVCHFVDTRDVDEKGHDWEDEYTIDKPATCTEEGSKSIHCKNCDAVKDSVVIDALNHDESITLKKATREADGRYTVKCKKCKETLIDEVIAKIKSIEFVDNEVVYDGEEQEPELIILDTNDHRLVLNTDYTVEYRDNVDVGTKAKAIITFIGNYDGTEVENFVITKASEKYTVPAGLSAVYGQHLLDIQLPSNFTWMDESLSVGNVGINTFKVKYTPTDDKNKETIENIPVNVVVSKADPLYEMPEELSATFGETLKNVELPDGWVWLNKKESVGNVGTNSFYAKFIPDDTDNYNVIKDVLLDVEVKKAIPTYEIPENLTATYGMKLSEMDALPIGFTWMDETLSVGEVGINKFKLKYTPEDEDNFSVVKNITVQVKVSKANPNYEIPEDLTAVYGQKLYEVSLPDGFAWMNSSQKVGNVGTNTFKAKYTPDDEDNYKTIKNISISIDVTKARPEYEVPEGLTATYGDTLADVDLPEGFEWKDESEEVGEVDTTKFYAIYTPEDTVNYKVVNNVGIYVKVKKAIPGYKVPEGLTAVYGQKLKSIELPNNFSWMNSSESVGNAGENIALAKYTPDDTDNYKIVNNIKVKVNVSKAEPEYEIPEGLEATYGDTLADVNLPKGFVWEDEEETVGNVGTNIFLAEYTPKDTNNFEIVSEIEIPIKVNAFKISRSSINLEKNTYTYSGKAIKPTVSITGLEEDNDYIVNYSDAESCDVGKYTVTIEGVGNYSGKETFTYSISRRDIADTNIVLANDVNDYTGAQVKPSVKITYCGNTLVKGKDYEITGYSDNIYPGNATIQIEGIGNYRGDTNVVFCIGQVSGLKVKSQTANSIAITWNKQAKVTGYQVYMDGRLVSTIKKAATNSYTASKLTAGSEHSFYVVGYVTTKVLGLSRTFEAPESTTIEIIALPATAAISSATTTAGTITAKWKTASCDGFEVMLATNTKFTSGKQEYQAESDEFEYTFEGLTKGKTYYVKVRTVKEYNGTTYYGSWSSSKKVKCK